MKKMKNLLKTDDTDITREARIADANAAAKTGVAGKQALPSILIKKDHKVAESELVTCTTMHVRQRNRESSGSALAKPQCSGHVPVPRPRDIPKPVTGRRSPPILPGSTQGPCGDLALRKSGDGSHKREIHSQCDNHPLLNHPPWKAACAIVEPTQAGNISYERLPKGLKQLKPVDLCYRHGHRRRLGHLEETQNTDAPQKRGRLVIHQKAHGPKQRGDFNTKKVIVERTTCDTIAEERHHHGSHGATKADEGSVDDNVDLTTMKASTATGCLQDERPGVSLDDSPLQGVLAQSDLISNGDITLRSAGCKSYVLDQKLCEITRQTTIPSISENTTDAIEGKETCPDEACISKVDLETSDSVLVHRMPSEPTLLKAESLTFRRTTGILHTDEPPRSFTSLTVKAKEPEYMEETTSQPTTEQPLSRMTIHESVQADECGVASPGAHSDSCTPGVKGNTTCHDDKHDNILESCVNDHDPQPCNKEESSGTVDGAAFDQHETSKNSRMTETQNKSSDDPKSSSREDEGDVSLDDKVQVHDVRHTANLDEVSQDEEHSLNIRSEKSSPISTSNSSTAQGASMQKNRELLSLTGTSPKPPINESSGCHSNPTTPTTVNPVKKQESVIGHFENQDANSRNLRGVSHEAIRQRPNTNTASPNETREVCVKISPQKENDNVLCPHLQRSRSCHDLPIDVRLFRTPENDVNDETCIHPEESPSSTHKNSGSQETSDGSYKTEGCTIRKLHSSDNSGKCKYLVLPDQDRIISGAHVIPLKPSKTDRDKGHQHRDTLEIATDRQSQAQNSSDTPTGSLATTSKAKRVETRNIHPRVDSIVSKPETAEGSSVLQIDEMINRGNIEQGTYSMDGKREKTDENHDMIASGKGNLSTDISRRARKEAECEEFPVRENETVDTGHNVAFQGEVWREYNSDEQDWFPQSVYSLPQLTAANVSGLLPKQSQPRRIKFSESNRFLRIHGNYLQGDGPRGHGDPMERPRNYAEPNVSLDDMSLRFFTDVTPLDLAFNAINVANSCSNSISYHSCANQKRLLAALDKLKHDDVYKHALICPLARQCAATTREFSQALHKVFRRFSNRARAAQEALLEYYRALADGEVNSPEMVRQIQRDGRSLYMVWEAGRYVTKYADDAVAEFSNSSSSDTSTHPGDLLENKPKE